MFGSNVLDVAIGVIFVFLFLSLTCTVINEAISSVINKRGKNLFEGVKNLLNDPEFTGLAQQVYNHGMVDSISRDAANPAKLNRLPSYMPAANFSLALLDILGARGVVAAAQGDLLQQAEKADDVYEQAAAAAAKNPGDPQLEAAGVQARAAQEQARGALEAAAAQAQTASDQAAQAAGANPGNAALAQAAAQARDAAGIAGAAVKMHDARRAAVAVAKDPKSIARVNEASALLEQALAAGRAFAANCPDPLGNIQHAVQRLPDGHTKESLLVLLDKTKREITAGEKGVRQFQDNLEGWYNDAMDRVGGWYKRWTQRILLGLAFVIVFAANADAVMLVQRLTMDSALRTSLDTAAQDAAKLAPASNNGAPNSDSPRIQAVVAKAESLKLPLGWSLDPNDPWHVPWDKPWWILPGWALSKLFGLLLSVFAVSLGAPFWFDTLSKFINLRGAGTPPGETKKSAPQPKPQAS
jgi:hypothetical protein